LQRQNITSYTFELNCRQWENLLVFLKQSKSCKKNIFRGFDIGKNKIDSYPIEWCTKEQILIEELFSKEPKIIKDYKQSISITKKFCLGDFVTIQKNGVSANLGRTKFIRFREFLLKNTSNIKGAV
jgi:hypothetical protein